MSITRSHPPNVAHYVGINNRISLQKKCALILDLKQKTVSDPIPLRIPLPSDMPPVVALSNKASIRWLMRQGYVPTLKGREVTFIPPGCESAFNQLLSQCDEVIDEVDGSVCELIEEFKYNLERNKLFYAKDNMERVLEKDSSLPLKKLHAAFLSLLGEREKAAGAYMELSRTDTPNAPEYLEQAFMCNPTMEVYQILSKYFHASDKERMMNYALFAYMHLAETKPDVALIFLGKAFWIESKKPLLYLAALNFATSVEKRKQLFGNLADHFRELGKKETSKYYLTKDPEVYQLYLTTPRQPVEVKPAAQREDDGYSTFLHDLDQVLAAMEEKRPEEADPDQPNAYDPQEYEKAKQKIVDNIKGHRTFAYYKGRLAACVQPCLLQGEGDKSDFPAVLEVLFQHYEAKGNWRKAEVIARLWHKNFGTINTGLHLAEVTLRNSKKEEAAQLLLGMAKLEHRAKAHANVTVCLNRIKEFDPEHKIFSLIERQILYLLDTFARFNVLYKEQKVKTVKVVPFSHATKENSPRSSISHSTSTFLIDDPVKVGCYISRSHRFVFTTKKVEVYSLVGESRTYALVIPRDLDIPPDKALSDKKTVQYLLQIGCIPVIQPNTVTFVLTDEVPMIRSFIEKAGRVMESLAATLRKNEPADATSSDSDEETQKCDSAQIEACLDHLSHFQVYLEEASPVLALDALNHASRCTPSAIAIQELLAEFLCHRQKPLEAAKIYLALGTRSYLEKAFMCNPEDEELDRSLKEGESPERRDFRYLFAFMQLRHSHPQMAESYYNQIGKSDLNQIEKPIPTEENIREAIANSPDPKTHKKIALGFVDQLIESQQYEQALEVVHMVINILKPLGWDRITGGEQGPFENAKNSILKRELAVFEALGDREGLQRAYKQLISAYTASKKLRKVSVVARFAFERLNDLSAGTAYVSSCEQKAKVVLSTAFKLLSDNMLFASAQILEKLPPKAQLSPDEEFMAEVMNNLLISLPTNY